ncbi:MAG: PHB depolymerase family esterase [Elusimicrobiota bacterium]|jgi:polyhydroxybutyrate depolymerase
MRNPFPLAVLIVSFPWIGAAVEPFPTDSCGVDAARFCQEGEPQGDKLARCLNEHTEELTDACQAALSEYNANRVWPDTVRTMVQGDLLRRYLIHLPRGYDGKTPLPVVLLFHGISGTPEIARRQTRMSEVADKRHFMVVYPEGIGGSWNAGKCCGQAIRDSVNDVGFVSDLLDQLQKNYPLDRSRVYAAGVDNGGMMVYRLAGELSRRLAAIASVGGTMVVDIPRAKRPVPVIEMHSIVKDRQVPFEGGPSKNPAFSGSLQPVPDTIAWWVKANYCRKKAAEVRTDLHFVTEVYKPAEGEPGAPVVLYKLMEGGPTWPDGKEVIHGWATGTLVQTVNASKIIWEFFKAHSLSSIPE